MKLIKEAFSLSMPDWLKTKYKTDLINLKGYNLDPSSLEFIDCGPPTTNRSYIFDLDGIIFYDMSLNTRGAKQLLYVTFPDDWYKAAYNGYIKDYYPDTGRWVELQKLPKKYFVSNCKNCCYVKNTPELKAAISAFDDKVQARRTNSAKYNYDKAAAYKFPVTQKYSPEEQEKVRKPYWYPSSYKDIKFDKSGYIIPELSSLKDKLFNKYGSRLSDSLIKKINTYENIILDIKYSLSNIFDTLDLKADIKKVKGLYANFTKLVSIYKNILDKLNSINVWDPIDGKEVTNTQALKDLAELSNDFQICLNKIKAGSTELGLDLDTTMLYVNWDDDSMYVTDEE